MSEVVSFDDEALILVDPQDRIVGHRNKAEVHQGSGTLHRAFSIFLFNHKGQVLLQKRSERKRLWPGFWSNTCCSHPRQGETYEIATQRRLMDELGIEAKLVFIYRFLYRADYKQIGAEHELCSVYVGLSESRVRPNRLEVAEYRWISYQKLDKLILQEPDCFTPWFKMEWEELRGKDHSSALSVLGYQNPSKQA